MLLKQRYLDGVIEEIGGVEDHIHILLFGAEYEVIVQAGIGVRHVREAPASIAAPRLSGNPQITDPLTLWAEGLRRSAAVGAPR
jgi:hypothetical protein